MSKCLNEPRPSTSTLADYVKDSATLKRQVIAVTTTMYDDPVKDSGHMFPLKMSINYIPFIFFDSLQLIVSKIFWKIYSELWIIKHASTDKIRNIAYIISLTIKIFYLLNFLQSSYLKTSISFRVICQFKYGLISPETLATL